MIGSAVGSSLVHEVGHQAAALLRLVPSLQEEMAQRAAQDRSRADAWRQFRRWASEIVADFWSVGKVGITGSLGIMSVVSLPRPFVFHFAARDVHPAPWLRVKLSCAMGNCLFPNPQWGRLADMWEQLYPAAGLKHELADRIARLDAMIPVVARLVANHRPPSLKGKSMREIMPVGRRQPRQLLDRFDRWKKNPGLMNDDPPTLVFSVLGQAKWAGKINAGDEGRLLNKTLKYWAFKRALQTGDSCVIGARSTALKIAMNSLSVR